jgi:hypothetical protein
MKVYSIFVYFTLCPILVAEILISPLKHCSGEARLSLRFVNIFHCHLHHHGLSSWSVPVAVIKDAHSIFLSDVPKVCMVEKLRNSVSRVSFQVP